MYSKSNFLRQESLHCAIEIALGKKSADTVIKNVSILDVYSGKFFLGDVAIYENFIVGVKDSYDGVVEVDGTNSFLVPGFIDAHVHIESSMMIPPNFESLVLPVGTTTAIWDPHEIANVRGKDGIRWALDWANKLWMDLFVMLPSCVPATDSNMSLETSGAELNVEDIIDFKGDVKVLGLAEMMNYEGLFDLSKNVMEKLFAFRGGFRDGHCPGMLGKELNACAVAGIHSCHESISLEEAKEKITKGFHVFIREGSCAKNALELLPLLTPYSSCSLAFCSDDRNPLDIFTEGHINYIVNQGLKLGLEAESVFRAASYGPAMTFGFFDRGVLAPGFLADFILLTQSEEGTWLKGMEIKKVFKGGKLVTKDALPKYDLNEKVSNNINISRVSESTFLVEGLSRSGSQELRIIDVLPRQLITKEGRASISANEFGNLESDVDQDLLKIAVIERHFNTGRVGVGFVRGFGLKHGALASSVNHDSHNLIVVGATDFAMVSAVEKLLEVDGGLVVWGNCKEYEVLRLEFAGLMTSELPEVLADKLFVMREFAKSLGCVLNEPFLQLSFLALPVIPELKITDRGLVDVKSRSVVSIFTDN